MKAAALFLAVFTVVGILGFEALTSNSQVGEPNDGPYRDGWYLGTLAAESGDSVHISAGRWVEAKDRQSFAAGYRLAYAETAAKLGQAKPQDFHRTTDAAYRDGLYLGKLDAEQGRTVHITEGRWSEASDRVSFRKGYRNGYENATIVNTAATSSGLRGSGLDRQYRQ